MTGDFTESSSERLVSVKEAKMINQQDFCATVAPLVGLKPSTVRSMLIVRGFEPTVRLPEGKYVRPYYTYEQIAKAVEFLKNRKKEFVEAARALGLGHYKIIFKHILPNSLTPIITFTPFFISMQIMGLASLDYLGFGLEVPTPSWGELLNQANKYFTIAWWLAVFPASALFASLTLLNLIGEGVRDAMDPNLT